MDIDDPTFPTNQEDEEGVVYIPATQETRFDLPGWNLPLNWVPEFEKMFPNALHYQPVEEGGDASLHMTTTREFEMLQVMNNITDKPDWEAKVFDDSIASKWRSEALNTEGTELTPASMDWVIEELRWRAEDFKTSRTVFVYNGDVMKSDEAVPESIRTELQQAIRPLEDVPESQKDYHPNTDDKVLDLVHPSLWPLMYGTSKILPNSLVPLENTKSFTGCGKELPEQQVDQTYDMNDKGQNTRVYSGTVQWLPCDVEFDTSGTSAVKITSYINNLNYEANRGLYGLVEQVIAKAVPLWNRTLSPLTEGLAFERLKRINFTDVTYDPDPENMSKEQQMELFGDEEEDEDAYRDAMDEYKRDHLVIPEPEAFKSPGPLSEVEHLSLQKKFGEKGIQVIVKLANIELTPEKPEYEGGNWHVEGQLNEHICATAIYYYDVENISDSYLSFRQLVPNDHDAMDIYYPQNEWHFLSEIFGCENEQAALQEVGSVLCKEGRLITFPNILQHRVEPFKLRDPTKPGHRKILALFLVDPHVRIISTANVPPQQLDPWFNDILADPRNPISRLPHELQNAIKDSMDYEDFPMSTFMAKEIRLELMQERSTFVETKNEEFNMRTFYLCEH